MWSGLPVLDIDEIIDFEMLSQTVVVLCEVATLKNLDVDPVNIGV